MFELRSDRLRAGNNKPHRVGAVGDLEVFDCLTDRFDGLFGEQHPPPSVLRLGRGLAHPSPGSGDILFDQCAGDVQVRVADVEDDVIEHQGEDLVRAHPKFTLTPTPPSKPVR
ncbi:hypothetical protein [Nocardia beijingensis]|uniref:hypothetical protein n=1 Tax=Nocardia beijingensis TaxID=95162 RepID=UPI0033A44D4A